MDPKLAFAKEYQHWIEAHWKKVIWLNKSTFVIGKRSQQIKVWCQDECYSLDSLALTFKLFIMVWRTFLGFGKCRFVFMPLNT